MLRKVNNCIFFFFFVEAEAAKSAGVVSVLVKREGNEEIPEEAAKAFPTVSSFKEIVFENSAKRKNEDETVPAEVCASKSRKHRK